MNEIPDIKQGPVSVESIYEIVGSAMNIPTVAKGQPTQFVVLNQIDALSDAAQVVRVPPFVTQALAAIVVCGDTEKAHDKDRWMEDCEAASQQILVTAHANGISSFISPIYPHQERIDGISKLLDLPHSVVAHSYVSIGYPAKVPGARDAFSNERVHYNSWVRRKSTF
jgi:nitroreductase